MFPLYLQDYLACATDKQSSWWASPCHDTLTLTLYINDPDSAANLTKGTYVTSSCIQQQIASNGTYFTAFVPKVSRTSNGLVSFGTNFVVCMEQNNRELTSMIKCFRGLRINCELEFGTS